MPHDYDDDDEAGFGLRESISEGSGADASAGFSVPGTPFIIAPYKSLAVFAKPNGGGTWSATVTWDFDGEAGGATAEETKTATLATGETLIFRNQGVQVTDITINGSADMAYAVMPSDVDPLARSATSEDAYSPHQDANLFGYDDAGAYYDHWATDATVDAACLHGGFLQSDGVQNAYFTRRFSLGPKGSVWIWEVLYRQTSDSGICFAYLASIPEDDPNYGANDNAGVLQDISTLNWILIWKLEMRAAVTTRNVKANPGVTSPLGNLFGSSLFRVLGDVGDPFTTRLEDNPPGVLAAIDGGPGMYALMLKMEDKNVASTGYRGQFQSLALSRCDWAFA
jgi:hypothetical protein